MLESSMWWQIALRYVRCLILSLLACIVPWLVSAAPEQDTKYATPFSYQLKQCLQRQGKNYFRDAGYNLIRFRISLGIGVLFGLLYRAVDQTNIAGMNNLLAACFVSFGFLGVINCNTSMASLYRQRTVFYREQASGMYHSMAYALSVFIVELPYTFIGSLLFSVSFYNLVGFQSGFAHFFQFVLLLYLCTLTFVCAGQCLIVMLPSLLVGNLAAGLFVTFCLLFGGVFIRKSSMPQGWVWLYYVSPIPKAMSAFLGLQFKCDPLSESCPIIYIPPESPCPHDDVTGATFTADYVMCFLDAKGLDTFGRDCGWLIFCIVLLRAVTAIGIAKVQHLKR
jgi:ABC-type multidrug transport system permease subunit